jgi:Protein of unknown function (DUF3268).
MTNHIERRVSQKAIARVKDPLPAPTVCPHCASPVKLVNNDVLYHGKSFGKWPYAYACTNDSCGAYVGLHDYTLIPLGTLANAATRKARMTAKAAFNRIWERGHDMTRSEAYAWLARQLDIPPARCHIGMFDIAMCTLVKELCEARA